MLLAKGLKKTMVRKKALDSLDLDVQPGDIYAPLGANGASKPPPSIWS